MRKVLILLASLGFLMVAVAVAFPPGLVSECGPLTHIITQKMPMDVFFVLDASASIRPANWQAEKEATVGMIEAFHNVSGGEIGFLEVGVAQFSTSTNLEIAPTGDLEKVKGVVTAMAQNEGATYMAPALQMCASQLATRQMEAPDDAQVCVLITDGEASDPEAIAAAKVGLNSSGVELMGIYVGTNPDDALKLKSFVCEENADCQTFASASNFDELRQRSMDIANAITLKVSKHTKQVDYVCDPPTWTLGALVLTLPALCWWLYLHCCLPKIEPEPEQEGRRDPLRLRAAGANERRSPQLQAAEEGRAHSAQEPSSCVIA